MSTYGTSGGGTLGLWRRGVRRRRQFRPTATRPTATAAYRNTAYGAQPNTATAPQDPYQQPIPPLAADQARAEAPGQPPVTRINPIRKPKKKRRAHSDEPTDPFAPTGIRAGSFEIYPAIELLGGYDSNPNATEGGDGAAVYTIAPELKVDSDWGRHSLKAELRGSYTGYSPDSSPTLSRPYLKGKVDGRFDLTRDTKINLGSNMLVSTDNPGSPDLQAGLSKLPLYFTMGHSAGITQSFNRFELKLTGDFERTEYQDSELTDGTTASNKDRNYNQFGGTLRGSYEMTPGVKPFVEVGADTRRHDQEPDSYGYDRNSKGITGKVGTTLRIDPPADRRGLARLYPPQLRRPAFRLHRRARRRRLADLDRRRAQHRQAHGVVDGGGVLGRRRLRRVLPQRRRCNTTTPTGAG